MKLFCFIVPYNHVRGIKHFSAIVWKAETMFYSLMHFLGFIIGPGKKYTISVMIVHLLCARKIY